MRKRPLHFFVGRSVRRIHGESGDEDVDVSFAGDGRHVVTQELQRRYPLRRFDGYTVVAA